MSSFETERESLLNRIYNINEKDFDTVAIDLFRYQYDFNVLYRNYCNLLGFNSLNKFSVDSIPFLPISMFRDHEIKTGNWEPQAVFRSSGTTDTIRSTHLIKDIELYHSVAHASFQKYYGDPSSFVWIALLPSYIERADSSLIDMVHYFMHINKKAESGFYKEIDDNLLSVLNALCQEKQKSILIGVSFALLELFEKYDVPVWDKLMVIETGGMKGRGAEITREELHERMKSKDSHLNIGSEYGMTELMSQAYLIDHHFHPSATMKVLTRDISDPLNLLVPGQRGVINVIDLGNLDSCAFVATDDIGIVHDNGSFDVLGRIDQSDVRGCNLLYT
jgi:hypothetical protein